MMQLDNRGGRQSSVSMHYQFTLDGKRYAWCRIRKNGCSAIQRLIIDLSPRRPAPSESEYQFLRRHHRVPRIEALRTADHRLLVLRDPVDRIRSVFANKFVQRSGNAGIFANFRAVTGRNPEKARFSDFVRDYAGRLGEARLDPHVWPQSWHLCPVIYDRVLLLDSLQDDMTCVIGRDLAARFFASKRNPSPATDVRVDEETRNRLAELYAEDIALLARLEQAPEGGRG